MHAAEMREARRVSHCGKEFFEETHCPSPTDFTRYFEFFASFWNVFRSDHESHGVVIRIERFHDHSKAKVEAIEDRRERTTGRRHPDRLFLCSPENCSTKPHKSVVTAVLAEWNATNGVAAEQWQTDENHGLVELQRSVRYGVCHLHMYRNQFSRKRTAI